MLAESVTSPGEVALSDSQATGVVQLSSRVYFGFCAVLAILFFGLGHAGVTHSGWIAVELMLTILSLFLFGSFRYQLDKNALTYGSLFVIVGTFVPLWWPSSDLKARILDQGTLALAEFIHRHFLTLHGLESLIHADTMLFILGLTFFVSVIAQTRLLESVSSHILKRQRGRVLPTVALLAGVVALCSGILDGVSMIGLMIRTLVIILALGQAEERDIIFAVIVSTVITTVSGMWMAYGEPPNLIMKANLYPHLDNQFFLRYCLPVAFGSYLIVAWNLRRRLKGRQINMDAQDVLDAHSADVRFLQASRHGEVFTPLEFIESQEAVLGTHFQGVHDRVLKGESLGQALIREGIEPAVRRQLLGHYVSEDLAEALNDHYKHLEHPETVERADSEAKVRTAIAAASQARIYAQRIGTLAFVPFIGLLIFHGLHHGVPLFLASVAGFAVAVIGVWSVPKMRTLALTDAVHEYKEYLFLFPLFLSISLLQKTGFFDSMAGWLRAGIEHIGASHVAYLQYWGACFLSAILDNNVVADFASKALHGLNLHTLWLFSMAQIAGYAVGGCWTHIGCAQSVVAYAFIRKEISPGYTPVQWMKSMTFVILEMSLFVTLVVYFEGWLLARVGG